MIRFLAAIRFLTILPVPGTWGRGEADLAGCVPFFPLVGLLLGAIAAALAWGLSHATTPWLTSALLIVAMLGFSGGLHLDGLSDTADGFLSSRPRERILEIMKDSHIGAMGVMAVVCVLLVKFAALASLRPEILWPTALLMPLAGRCAMVLHMAILPYVRENGLGTLFCKRRPHITAAWAAALLVLVGAAVLGLAGLVATATSLLVTLLLAIYNHRKIGGSTGDTFGAACELIELVPALTLAFWPLK